MTNHTLLTNADIAGTPRNTLAGLANTGYFFVLIAITITSSFMLKHQLQLQLPKSQ